MTKIRIAIALSILSFSVHSQSLWSVYNTVNSILPENQIWAIEEDRNGVIWIGTDEGLARFDGTSWSVIDSSNSGLPSNQIRSIAFDSANHLWVGTLQTGFSTYDGSGWQHFDTQNTLLPDDQVRCITFDTSRRAWIGTAGGVSYQSDEGWISYTMFNSPLGANNITKIFIDRNDIKWIGTVNGGISKKEGNTWTVYKNTNSGLTDNTVYDLQADTFGNIWFATPAQGLGRFNGIQWYYRLDANSSIPTNALTTLQIVKETDVKYIGTFDKGLIRWNNGLQFDSFTVNNSPLPDNHVSCLKRARNGKLWIGTVSGGVAVFTDTTSFPLINSVSETHPDFLFSMFPNPVYDELTLATPLSGELVIFDAFGRLTVKEPLAGGVNTFDLSLLSKGIYMVKILSKSGSQSTKTLIKN